MTWWCDLVDQASEVAASWADCGRGLTDGTDGQQWCDMDVRSGWMVPWTGVE